MPVPTADSQSASPAPLIGAPNSAAFAAVPAGRTTISAVAVGGVVGGTATPAVSPTPNLSSSGTPVAYDRNPNAILIEADVSGGPKSAPLVQHVPLFRLYADGLVLFAMGSAPLSTGMDSVIGVGHLSDEQIQDCLRVLNDAGFYSLNALYEPHPRPQDMETAHISVYLNRAKTVEVYGPEAGMAPPAFAQAFDRITHTVPADASRFVPAEARLQAVPVGSASDYPAAVEIETWPSDIGVRLSDAVDGVALSGRVYSAAADLVARTLPTEIYREGEQVYRVRFAPTLPRSVELTNWVSAIAQAPREFDGRVFDITGYYRGANLYGEVRGNPTSSRDWVIKDESGAMYVTGGIPRGLDPSSRADAWTVIHLRAVVVYVRLGVSHLEARQIQSLSGESLMLATRPTVPASTYEPTPALTPQFLTP